MLTRKGDIFEKKVRAQNKKRGKCRSAENEDESGRYPHGKIGIKKRHCQRSRMREAKVRINWREEILSVAKSRLIQLGGILLICFFFFFLILEGTSHIIHLRNPVCHLVYYFKMGEN